MVFTTLLSVSALFQRMQDDQRDLTLRLLLVAVVTRIHLDHLLPQAGFLLLVRLLRPYPHLAVSDLDRRIRVSHQVQVPRWMFGRTTIRGDQYEILTVPGVEERCRAALTALAARGIEEQHRPPEHLPPDAPIGRTIYGRVGLPHCLSHQIAAS